MLGGGHGWLCSHSGSHTNHLSCSMWQCTIASLTRVKWCRWWCKSPHHWDQRNQMQRVVTRPDLLTFTIRIQLKIGIYMYNNYILPWSWVYGISIGIYSPFGLWWNGHPWYRNPRILIQPAFACLVKLHIGTSLFEFIVYDRWAPSRSLKMKLWGPYGFYKAITCHNY